MPSHVNVDQTGFLTVRHFTSCSGSAMMLSFTNHQMVQDSWNCYDKEPSAEEVVSVPRCVNPDLEKVCQEELMSSQRIAEFLRQSRVRKLDKE